MSQENFSHSQEEVNTSSAPKPFDPKDEARIAELNAKFEGGVVQKKEEAPKFEIVDKELSGFEGATIVKKGDTYFAISKSPSGDLWASEFKLTPDGNIGATYQVHDLDQFKDVLTQVESREASEKMDKVGKSLVQLYRDSDLASDGFDPFQGRFSGDSRKRIAEARTMLESLSSSEQEAVATKFFEDTIGKSVSNNRQAYMVYGALKGTTFSSKFKELESSRLQDAGYGNLTI